MALKISISADSKFPFERKKLRTAILSRWKDYSIATDANLSFSVVGKRKMAELHEKYLHKNGPTDVLAFPQQSSGGKNKGFVSPKEVPLELGDIVICYPLVLNQAAKLGVLVDDRIVELALHGMKNLMNGEKLGNNQD